MQSQTRIGDLFMRTYGVYELNEKNIKNTVKQVFDNSVEKQFQYAVLYYEKRDEIVSHKEEYFGMPMIKNTHETNYYGSIILCENEYDALYHWRQIPNISNRNYYRVGVISRKGKVLITEENEQ